MRCDVSVTRCSQEARTETPGRQAQQSSPGASGEGCEGPGTRPAFRHSREVINRLIREI